MRTSRVLAAMVVPALVFATILLRQVAVIQDGSSALSQVVLGDTDHDSLPELSFYRSYPDRRYVWQTYETQSLNSYFIVKSETCIGTPNPPPGMHKGLFMPTDIGDSDEDGLAEILGVNSEYFDGRDGSTAGTDDSVRLYLCIYESPRDDLYPDTLVWSYCYGTQVVSSPHAWFPGDLDRDGRQEIVFSDPDGYTHVFENRGDNEYEQVWVSPLFRSGTDYAFGDFDGDSLTEFVYARNSSDDYVYVFECAGDDQYELVDSIFHAYPNGMDVFSGNDLDQDGRLEFYIVYLQYVAGGHNYYVVMYEATGNNSYQATLIDSVCTVGSSQARNSLCCDIDLDGIEELLVSYNAGMNVYKAVADNRFDKVANWRNTEPVTREAHIKCHDMNANGYPDIVISGGTKTWFLEVSAVELLAPNGGDTLVPGEPCTIAWRTYRPPWCDSVSLFLRRGSGWDLDTIVTGLPGQEHGMYPWLVPPGPLDSCRVVAVAYGPGWQYDESDSAFSILPGGVAEQPSAPGGAWSLDVAATPGRANRICYQVPVPTAFRLDVLDVRGRRVRLLASGPQRPGIYTLNWDGRDDRGHEVANGIYFYHLATPGFEDVKKAVVTR